MRVVPLHALGWLSSVVCFAIGTYVGWNVNANVGAMLWGLSAVLAFLPFLSHRHDDAEKQERRDDWARKR